MTGPEHPSSSPSPETPPPQAPSFRLAYVPGATPAKWVRIWRERLPDAPLTLIPASAAEAPGMLRSGEADAGLLRLPVDGDDLSAIPLYTETTVVIVPKDHLVTAAEEVTTADLAEEILLHPLDDTLGWERPPGQPAKERPATTGDAVELVAAGIGLLVVPQSLARLHHRRDLTYRPVTDAPQSRVGLSWPQERTTDQVEDFIGIVRGRTVNSWRGRSQPKDAEKDSGRSAAKGATKSAAKGAAKSAAKGRGRAQPKRGTAKGGRRGAPRRRS